MNDKDKRELIELIEQYGTFKEEIGENKALLTRDLELEFKKDTTLNKIINIIKEV